MVVARQDGRLLYLLCWLQRWGCSDDHGVLGHGLPGHYCLHRIGCQAYLLLVSIEVRKSSTMQCWHLLSSATLSSSMLLAVDPDSS